MTFFVALAIMFLAAAVLLISAGREFLRVNGFPQRQGHDIADVVHLASLGFSALNEASADATRRRMRQGF